jgi:hypothetical protein
VCPDRGRGRWANERNREFNGSASGERARSNLEVKPDSAAVG